MTVSKAISSRKSNADAAAKQFRLSPAARQIVRSPTRFINKLKIRDKQGKVIRLKLTNEQNKMLDSLMIDDKGTLVLKARQIGASTVTAAYLFWRWYSSEEPITIALLSHKLESAKQLFKMFQRFYSQLPKSLRRPLEVQNTSTLKFQDSGAEILALSSQGEGGLRSFTANYLMISEYAFASDPEELMATARAALNDGKLIIESTANYYNDCLHKEVLKAMRGEASWDYLFFPWSEHANYKKELPVDSSGNSLIEWSREERDLLSMNELSGEQVYWRRSQIEKFGYDKFRREYPLTIEDAYAQVGDSYFQDLSRVPVVNIHFPTDQPVILIGARQYGTPSLEAIQVEQDAKEANRLEQLNPLPLTQRGASVGRGTSQFEYVYDNIDREWVKKNVVGGGSDRIYDNNNIGGSASLPISTDLAAADTDNKRFNDYGQELHTITIPMGKPAMPKFVIGCDVAGGNGRDYSTIVVMNKVDMSICALYRSNTVSLKEFSDVILHLANMYNRAGIMIEKNNHGHAILAYLNNSRYTNILNGPDGKPGWNTNVKTKSQMFEDMKYVLESGSLPYVDQITYSELRSFIVNARGNIEYPKSMTDSHGDMTIALCLAYQAWKVTSYPRNDGLDTWVQEKKAKERTAAYLATSKQRY